MLQAILPKLPRPTGARQLIAVAGPPASGKTTLAETLARMLPNAAYVPMDGFHLDNALLDARGLRPRKGAPQTFDAMGFVALVQRLHQGKDVVAPLFDRTRDLSVAGALHIPASCPLVVVEGNYLLFDADPWRELRPLWSYSIWLDVPLALLEHRLLQRWRDHGYPEGEARAKALQNDLPNARLVMDNRLPCDLVLPQCDAPSD